MKLSDEEHQWIYSNSYSKFRFVWDILTVLTILSTLVTLSLEFSLFNNTSQLDVNQGLHRRLVHGRHNSAILNGRSKNGRVSVSNAH